MNNLFNLERFGLLLKRHWLEYGKTHLITLGIITGVILGFYGYAYASIVNNAFGGPGNLSKLLHLNFRLPLFIIFGIIIITMVASQYFAPLGQKAKAIIELTLPTSTFEKFLAGITISVVMGIISYLTIFYLIDLAFVSKLQNTYHFIYTETIANAGGDKVTTSRESLVYFFKQQSFKDAPLALYVLPFTISSIFLLGSIYFNKSHYIKSMLSLLISMGICGAILVQSAKLVYENTILIEKNILLNNKISGFTLLLIFLIMLTLVFWVITFMRLREKEV